MFKAPATVLLKFAAAAKKASARVRDVNERDMEQRREISFPCCDSPDHMDEWDYMFEAMRTGTPPDNCGSCPYPTGCPRGCRL